LGGVNIIRIHAWKEYSVSPSFEERIVFEKRGREGEQEKIQTRFERQLGKALDNYLSLVHKPTMKIQTTAFPFSQSENPFGAS